MYDNVKSMDFKDWTVNDGYGAVYLYTFDNGKKYVGQTILSVKERLRNHYHSDCLVDKAMKKNAFTVELLDVVPIDQLDDREKFFIAQYGCIWPDGYNMTDGGNNYNLLPETRKRMSAEKMGNKNPMWGKKNPHMKEVQMMSVLLKREPVVNTSTGEIFLSISDAVKAQGVTNGQVQRCCQGYQDTARGVRFEFKDEGMRVEADFHRLARGIARDYNLTHPTEEVIKHRQEAGYKVSQSNIGKKHSDEWKSNITKSLEGKICSPNGLAHMIAKNKVSPSFKGHKHTEEQKQRMSEMRKGAGNGMFGKYGKDNPGSKAVVAYSYPDMTELKTYASAAEASADLGVTFQAVSACCREKIKSTLGKYTFRFA